jgi:Spy/CpxP family protein refolding chaperone
MKVKHAVMAALAAGMISAAGVVAAQPMEGGWHHGAGMEFLYSLKLTDAQKQQVHQIVEAARAQAKPVMTQMHTLHEQIITQLLTAGSTEADIQALVQQEEQLRNQLDSARVTTALQIRGLLTPDQLTQASTLHQKLSALHEQEHAVMESPEDAQ